MTSIGTRRLGAVAGRGAAVAAVVGVALVTAACGPTAQAGGGSGASPSAQPGSPSASAQPGSGAAGTAPAMSAPTASASAAAGPPTCTVGMLKAVLDGSPSTSSQSKIRLDLIFTNTSGDSCVLDGNPGVKLTGVPSSDVWDVRSGLTAVTLAPGGEAHSLLQYSDGLDDSGSDCGPHPAGVLVTPPNSYSSLSLPWLTKVPVCDNGTIEVMYPVEPGAGPDLHTPQ